MISYGKQTIDQDDIMAVIEILRGDWLTQGPAVEQFESDLKSYFGSNHACVVSNGTAALHLAGLALGWKKGDIVITSPLTFLATANSIVYAGATPDFVDIDPITYTIDISALEEKVKLFYSEGKKVKAVIGVDFAGQPCNWNALRELADRYNFQLINDNCHALGASYFKDRKYAVKYADVVIQSYHPVKHITTGEGGAVLTNNAMVDERVRRLRTHGMTKDPNLLTANDGPWYYEMHELGFNYRLTDFQCALGSNQLKKLNSYFDRRKIISEAYDISFSGNDYLIIPSIAKDAQSAFHLYPLQINFKNLSMDKRTFFARLQSEGINLQVHYIPIHAQPFYKKKYGFKYGEFPNAEKFYQNEVSLPIYPTLSSEEQNRVICAINENLV